MAVLTSTISRFLSGVEAKFQEVRDQARDAARAYDLLNLYEATPNLTPIVQRINLTGQQLAKFTFVSGIMGYLEETGELQPFKEGEYRLGYTTTVQPHKFTKRIKVSQESYERRDPAYVQALDEASKLDILASLTLSKHTFDVFNHMRTAPSSLPSYIYVYNDGRKLASILHPLVGGGTQSNVLASSPALSVDALDSAEVLMANTKDDTGKPMPVGGGQKYLVVSPALTRKAVEITETSNTPYTNNFVANVFYGKYIILTSPYITSPTAWTLVDAMFSPLRQAIFKDVSTSPWYDENVKAFVYDVEAQWAIGAIDFRGIVHSTGDGVAVTD